MNYRRAAKRFCVVSSRAAVVAGLFTACSDTSGPLLGAAVEARGHYVVGFEANSFVPCGSSEGWWVRSLDDAPAVAAYLAAHPPMTPTDTVIQFTRMFVDWRGVRSARGQYGHIGGSPYEFTPTSVREVREMRASDCQQSR